MQLSIQSVSEPALYHTSSFQGNNIASNLSLTILILTRLDYFLIGAGIKRLAVVSIPVVSICKVRPDHFYCLSLLHG